MQIKVNKIQIYSIVFSVSALLLIVFLIYPAMNDIKYNSDKILENKSQLLFNDEQTKAVANFQKNYSTYEPNLKKIDQSLVDPKDPVSVIKFFESTGSEAGLNLDVSLIESDKNKNWNGLNSINFTIDTTGSFSRIMNFANNLEKGPYLIRVKSLTLNKSSGDNKDNNIDAQFSIYVVTQDSP